MPDITMCINIKCEQRGECYRYRCVPSDPRQSMCGFKEKDCDNFLHILTHDIVRDLKDVDSVNLLFLEEIE